MIVMTPEATEANIEAVKKRLETTGVHVIVLPGDSYHIAAVEPELCAQHALAFIEQVSASKTARAAE